MVLLKVLGQCLLLLNLYMGRIFQQETKGRVFFLFFVIYLYININISLSICTAKFLKFEEQNQLI